MRLEYSCNPPYGYKDVTMGSLAYVMTGNDNRTYKRREVIYLGFMIDNDIKKGCRGRRTYFAWDIKNNRMLYLSTKWGMSAPIWKVILKMEE